MLDVELLRTRLQDRLTGCVQEAVIAFNELTIHVLPKNLYEICLILRDESGFEFNQLIDVTVVDYLKYGVAEWDTQDATFHGFSRGVKHNDDIHSDKPRYAVVYHLLSLALNQRLRIKVYVSEQDLIVPSVVAVWPAANWFEREAYDLFGVIFNDHPDLRRLLTDYGFVGHPFRKDFPLSGHVEVHYDAAQGRVVYGPLEIEPRITIPKVIRHDNRYKDLEEKHE